MFFPVIISILLIGSGIIAGLVKTGRIKRGYGIQSKTRRGEIVKSKAEKKVADTLDYAGVKYLYESPLSLKVGKRWKTVRPDFYLPEYDLYIEYRGLTHLDDYTRKMNWKKKQYRNNGITWIDVTSKTLAHFHETVTKITMKKKIPLWKRYMKIVFGR